MNSPNDPVSRFSWGGLTASVPLILLIAGVLFFAGERVAAAFMGVIGVFGLLVILIFRGIYSRRT